MMLNITTVLFLYLHVNLRFFKGGKIPIMQKENFIRNMKKRNHQNWLKSRLSTIILTIGGGSLNPLSTACIYIYDVKHSYSFIFLLTCKFAFF
jgi:hypothetical protein